MRGSRIQRAILALSVFDHQELGLPSATALHLLRGSLKTVSTSDISHAQAACALVWGVPEVASRDSGLPSKADETLFQSLLRLVACCIRGQVDLGGLGVPEYALAAPQREVSVCPR